MVRIYSHGGVSFGVPFNHGGVPFSHGGVPFSHVGGVPSIHGGVSALLLLCVKG